MRHIARRQSKAAFGTESGHTEKPNDSRANAILDYWFGDIWDRPQTFVPQEKMSSLWYSQTQDIDKEIQQKFGADLLKAAAGGYDHWRSNKITALAGIVLMDQLTRNAYRGSAKMYSLDDKALGWAKQLLESGQATELKPVTRGNLYLPFMHSEVLEDQEACVRYLAQEMEAARCMGEEWAPLLGFWTAQHKYAVMHRDIVKAWHRFPHRNAILGRQNTPEEIKGLADGTIASF